MPATVHGAEQVECRHEHRGIGENHRRLVRQDGADATAVANDAARERPVEAAEDPTEQRVHDAAEPVWQTVSLFNPIVYLVSGFRWSVCGIADVNVGVSLALALAFLALCLVIAWWIFKTGYRLTN